MLVLTRRPGESFHIGDEIIITVNSIKGNQVKIAIAAPEAMRVYRQEIYLEIQEEKRNGTDRGDGS